MRTGWAGQLLAANHCSSVICKSIIHLLVAPGSLAYRSLVHPIVQLFADNECIGSSRPTTRISQLWQQCVGPDQPEGTCVSFGPSGLGGISDGSPATQFWTHSGSYSIPGSVRIYGLDSEDRYGCKPVPMMKPVGCFSMDGVLMAGLRYITSPSYDIDMTNDMCAGMAAQNRETFLASSPWHAGFKWYFGTYRGRCEWTERVAAWCM
jgi:hypothetical protein